MTPTVQAALERAVAQAAIRLDDPRCALILTEFHDAFGHPLDERLASMGLSASAYVRRIPFRTGRGLQRCDASTTILSASVGLPVVYVCEAQYLRMEKADPEYVVATVLHETLHTLGLGENPPGSREITARVRKRCGKGAAQPPVVTIDPRLRPSFHDTVTEAAVRLGKPECAQILTDFQDVAGRPLARHLELTGLDASAYVRSVGFHVGRGVRQCQSTRILLAAKVGQQFVWVCEAQYYRMERQAPDLAVAMVLHEILHTLGLGENPPSTTEITERVLDRCGKAAL